MYHPDWQARAYLSLFHKPSIYPASVYFSEPKDARKHILYRLLSNAGYLVPLVADVNSEREGPGGVGKEGGLSDRVYHWTVSVHIGM